ncbi:MAG: hypothetical protein WDN24_07275 [Sphingomonas sp.]
MRQNILIFGGILAFLLGILFLLQGLGVVRWPETSMMIDQRVWAYRGGALAIVGLLLAAAGRLVPAKKRKGDG